MKKKSRNDRLNPLLQQDNKLSKRIFRIICVIIYLLTLVGFKGAMSSFSDEVNLPDNYVGVMITDTIIVILFTWFIFGKVLNKDARESMRGMRGSCTYEEMYDLLSNQIFHKVDYAGAEVLYESELWLKVNGAFIPKNFVVAGYDIDKIHGSKHFELILLNGRQVMYCIGTKEEWFVNAIKYFNEKVPHGNFNNLYYFGRYQSELRAQLREKFKKYKEEGNSVEDLINNFTDFSEGIDYLSY